MTAGEPAVTATGRSDRGRDRRLEGAVGHLSAGAARREAAEFERGLAAITAYAREHGHTRPPDGHRDRSGFPLAAWVAEQRAARLEDRLAADRRAALERVDRWDWAPVPGTGHGGGECPESGRAAESGG